MKEDSRWDDARPGLDLARLARAAGAGLLAGLTGAAFRAGLAGAERLREQLLSHAHSLPWGVLLPVLCGALGAGIAVFLVRRVAPEAAGSGIQHVEEVLAGEREMLGHRVLPVKFFGGLLSMGTGLALGREGPIIQMGGAAGQLVARWAGSHPEERRTLIAAGAGGGLAAAFNAPLSGLLFVLEELQRDFRAGILTAAFVAAIAADVVVRGFTGQGTIFQVVPHPPPPLGALPFYLALGLAAGAFGVVFNRGVIASLDLFRRAGRWPPGLTGALVGAAVGLIAWFEPSMVGGGEPIAQALVGGAPASGALPLFFLLRFGLTLASYGSGAPGGIFAPLLVLGAQLGTGVGQSAAWLAAGGAGHPASYAVVGMAACFAAIVRAPVTGIVLIVEMTRDFSLMLPLLVASFAASVVADALGEPPIYTALRRRDLNLERGD